MKVYMILEQVTRDRWRHVCTVRADTEQAALARAAHRGMRTRIAFCPDDLLREREPA